MGTITADSGGKSDLETHFTKLGLKEMQLRTQMYPCIEPNQSGSLKVSDIHTLYWEESGNSGGQVESQAMSLKFWVMLARFPSEVLCANLLKLWVDRTTK